MMNGNPKLCEISNNRNNMKGAGDLNRLAKIMEMVFMHTLSPVAILDRDFNFICVNKAYASAGNRDVSEFPGRNYFEISPSNTRIIFENVVRTKTPYRTFARPYTCPRDPEGGTTYWDWTLVPVLDGSGEVNTLILSLQDVTRSVKAERALREALEEPRRREKIIAALYDSSLAVLNHHNFNDTARVIYEKCRDLLGATAGYVSLRNNSNQDEVVYFDAGNLPCTVDPSHPIPIRGLREAACKNQKVIYHNNFKSSKWANLLPPGHVALENVMLAPLVANGKTMGLLAFGNKPGGFTEDDAQIATTFSNDIAMVLHNSRLLEQLRHNEMHFRSIAQSAKDAIITIDSNVNIVFWNKAAENIFGFSEREAIGAHISIILPAHAREKYTGVLEKLLAGKERIRDIPFDFTGITNNGCEVPLEVSISRWQSGEQVYLSGIMRDISRHKRYERELSRFASVVDSSQDGIISTTPNGIIESWNHGAENMYGYKAKEIIGKHISTIVPGYLYGELKSVTERLIRGESVKNHETFLVKKDGTLLDVAVTVSPIRDEKGKIKAYSSIHRDITGHKKMQREMLRLDRLNLVGQMAAGIGHEIRNPITTVRGLLQILKEKNNIPLHDEHFSIMIDELDRASAIIKQFLSLASNRAVDRKMQSLKNIIETILPLITADAYRRKQYILAELQHVPELLLDEKEIRQLILNLARNGLEAMPAGGKLVISTYTEDDCVVLAVRDQGTGIKPEVFKKVGTPFFTTKESGTGLGLAICHSIADRHNARINIETGNNGTTVFVRFALPADAKP